MRAVVVVHINLRDLDSGAQLRTQGLQLGQGFLVVMKLCLHQEKQPAVMSQGLDIILVDIQVAARRAAELLQILRCGSACEAEQQQAQKKNQLTLHSRLFLFCRSLFFDRNEAQGVEL